MLRVVARPRSRLVPGQAHRGDLRGGQVRLKLSPQHFDLEGVGRLFIGTGGAVFHAGLDERADMEFKQGQKPVSVSLDAVLIVATIRHRHPFIPKLAAAEASKYFLRFILGFFFCRGRRPLMGKSLGL